MLCVATDKAVVEKAAVPLLSETVPSLVVPLKKLTLPAGVPVVEDFTVAVNVTFAPEVEGFSEDTIAVEVPALLTTCTTAGEVLPAKFVSPEYTAVIEAPVEIFKVELEKLALPAPLMVPLPRRVEPFLNATVPVGVPEPVCETVAVNTTSCPNSAGFSEEVNAVVVVDSIFSVSVDDVLPR